MTKQEFIKELDKIGRGLNFRGDDYEQIEFVYTYHPSIDGASGKAKIAILYGEFGMRVIRDMIPTAKKAQECVDKIRTLRNELNSAIEEYEALKRGDD